MAKKTLAQVWRAGAPAEVAVPERQVREGTGGSRHRARYDNIRAPREGTLMRHFIAKARPVTPAALGVLEATRVARCITPARGLLGEAPGFSGAPPGTVALAAVTAAADKHLGTATGADVQARGGQRHRLVSISR